MRGVPYLRLLHLFIFAEFGFGDHEDGDVVLAAVFKDTVRRRQELNGFKIHTSFFFDFAGSAFLEGFAVLKMAAYKGEYFRISGLACTRVMERSA
jgi:hypothetical protein